jgi:hypothetical protein
VVRVTRLIGLWGFAGSGKDEAAKALVEDGWRRDAFADRMRAMLLALDPYVDPGFFKVRLSEMLEEYDFEEQPALAWDMVKRDLNCSPEVRRLLQRLGTEAGRGVLGENVWINALMNDWHVLGYPRTVVTDCRFENEARAIRDAGGLTVAILRPGVGPVNGHASETALAGWPFDFTVHNDRDVEHLHEVIRAIGHGPANSVNKANTEVQL